MGIEEMDAGMNGEMDRKWGNGIEEVNGEINGEWRKWRGSREMNGEWGSGDESAHPPPSPPPHFTALITGGPPAGAQAVGGGRGGLLVWGRGAAALLGGGGGLGAAPGAPPTPSPSPPIPPSLRYRDNRSAMPPAQCRGPRCSAVGDVCPRPPSRLAAASGLGGGRGGYSGFPPPLPCPESLFWAAPGGGREG